LLHKGAWIKFKGYAYSQLAQIREKTSAQNPKRAASIAKHGYDLKYAVHLVRLLAEVEQILIEGDLDIERNREQLKAVRRGEWTLTQVEDYFTFKERSLEDAYIKSTLPTGPDEERVKTILLECLEMHYGNLDSAVTRHPKLDHLLTDLQIVVDKYKRRG
jgi:hypothetical protein